MTPVLQPTLPGPPAPSSSPKVPAEGGAGFLDALVGAIERGEDRAPTDALPEAVEGHAVLDPSRVASVVGALPPLVATPPGAAPPGAAATEGSGAESPAGTPVVPASLKAVVGTPTQPTESVAGATAPPAADGGAGRSASRLSGAAAAPGAEVPAAVPETSTQGDGLPPPEPSSSEAKPARPDLLASIRDAVRTADAAGRPALGPGLERAGTSPSATTPPSPMSEAESSVRREGTPRPSVAPPDRAPVPPAAVVQDREAPTVPSDETNVAPASGRGGAAPLRSEPVREALRINRLTQDPAPGGASRNHSPDGPDRSAPGGDRPVQPGAFVVEGSPSERAAPTAGRPAPAPSSAPGEPAPPGGVGADDPVAEKSATAPRAVASENRSAPVPADSVGPTPTVVGEAEAPPAPVESQPSAPPLMEVDPAGEIGPVAPDVRATPDAPESVARPALPPRLSPAAWLSRLASAGGAQSVQVALGGGDGTVRLQTQRDGDGMAVTVRFSDPELQALAATHVGRLREALDAHFVEPVRLVLADALGADAGGTSEHAPGDDPGRPAPRPAAGRPAPSATDDPPAPAPPATRGGRREWVG